MSERIFFIGIDVDDKNFHGCVYQRGFGIVTEFKCGPNIGHLEKKIAAISNSKDVIRLCYEATYIGYTLQRDLAKRGYQCEVIAPSLIPGVKGKRQKTDKIDSRKLAEYYANGQLTAVHIPTESEERVRDFVRSRHFVMNQVKEMKLHILSQCRRCGIDYKSPHGAGFHHWTEKHRIWLRSKIEYLEEYLRMNFEFLLGQLEHQESLLERYHAKIEEISQTPAYKRKVQALSCYRGLSTLSSMTIISELGDIRRFPHPRRLTSYAGLDIVEYSSGGKHRQYGISKQGNHHLRRVVIEACQQAKSRPALSKRLKSVRKETEEKFIEIADRCMNRLYKRSQHLLNRSKCPNKVKVACARELLSFIWESLQAEAA